MPLDDRPETTRLGRPKNDAGPARLVAQHSADLAYRADASSSLTVVQRHKQRIDCTCLQPVQLVERPSAIFGQPDDLATAIGRRLLPDRQSPTW
jgi:hypothetical protein